MGGCQVIPKVTFRIIFFGCCLWGFTIQIYTLVISEGFFYKHQHRQTLKPGEKINFWRSISIPTAVNSVSCFMAVGKEANFPACQKTGVYNEKAFNANWEYSNDI